MQGKYARVLGVTATAVGLLAACGGDGDGTPATSPFVAGTEVPIGVEQNVGDVIAFAKQQIAATSDSTDPVLIGDARVATDDTADPADI